MERFISFSIYLTFVTSILAMIVPAFLVYYYQIPSLYFIIANTTGLVLSGIFIVITMGINLAITSIDGEKTDFTIRNNIMCKVLLFLVPAAQLLNLAFVQIG